MINAYDIMQNAKAVVFRYTRLSANITPPPTPLPHTSLPPPGHMETRVAIFLYGSTWPDFPR